MLRSRVLDALIWTCALLFSAAVPDPAHYERPFYLDGELGAPISPGATIVGESNDRAYTRD